MKTNACYLNIYLLLVAFVFGQLPAGLWADIIATTSEGLKVRLREDHSWSWVSENDSIRLLNRIEGPEQAVRVWNARLEHENSEYDFDKEVHLYLDYENLTTKPITGIKVEVIIRNSFNEVVLERTLQEEVLLAPGKKQITQSYWIYDNIDLLGKSPYQKLWRLAENGTAKIETKIIAVAFIDGVIVDDITGVYEFEGIHPEKIPPDPNLPLISEESTAQDTLKIPTKHSLSLQRFGDILPTTAHDNITSSDERPFDFVPWDDPPVPIGRIDPEYPDFARRARIQGTVVLEVDVFKDGTIGNIEVKRSVQPGPGGVDEAAINAVRKVRFQPGKSLGKPVDTKVIIPLEFKFN